ncbi:hypothetical protein AGMMS49982_10910 [Bacteroidia bacterium]|nr:hypothetical protein AGMMS49982_10910 [Bacteroidia bacterium]
MDYEKLSIIAEQVIAGKATITRLDNEEEQGRIAGGRRNVEATLAIGTANELHKDKQIGANIAINEQSAQQKSILKQYAELTEQNGNKIWYSQQDIDCLKDNSIAQSGGAEADVYFMPDEFVVKVIEHYGTPLEFLDDRISLYNYLFPETHYELLGFTDNPFESDYVSFVVRQKQIDGFVLLKYLKEISIYDKKMRAETEQKLHETIVRYMKVKFDAVPAYSSNTYANSNYIIRDLHLENIISERNVLTFPNEHLYIIDANVSLNADTKNNGVRNYCRLVKRQM